MAQTKRRLKYPDLFIRFVRCQAEEVAADVQNDSIAYILKHVWYLYLSSICKKILMTGYGYKYFT